MANRENGKGILPLGYEQLLSHKEKEENKGEKERKKENLEVRIKYFS